MCDNLISSIRNSKYRSSSTKSRDLESPGFVFVTLASAWHSFRNCNRRVFYKIIFPSTKSYIHPTKILSGYFTLLFVFLTFI